MRKPLTFILIAAIALAAAFHAPAARVTYENNKIAIGLAVSDETTDLTTSTGALTIRAPYDFTIVEVRAYVATAPVGANLLIDVNEAGVSVFSTVLSIDDGEKTSSTAATAAVISDNAIAAEAEITIDIDQIGSTTAGAGLKLWIIGRRHSTFQ